MKIKIKRNDYTGEMTIKFKQEYGLRSEGFLMWNYFDDVEREILECNNIFNLDVTKESRMSDGRICVSKIKSYKNKIRESK